MLNAGHPDRAVPVAGQQDLVDAHFRSTAFSWKEIYQRRDLSALIHQRRRGIVLGFMERLSLPAGSRLLEIGCGAGVTAVELARRGYTVEAVDAVEPMLDLTRQLAAEAGVGHRVSTILGDAHHLRFPDELFSAVLAIGVIPWLHSPSTALREMARVLKPAGHLIVNADNRWRLTDVLDPRLNPLYTGLRKTAGDVLERSGLRQRLPALRAHAHSLPEFDALLASVGLEKTAGTTVGFGPFSFLDHTLPDSLGIRIHDTLQAMADRRFPVLRSTGAQYIVLARKPARRPQSS